MIRMELLKSASYTHRLTLEDEFQHAVVVLKSFVEPWFSTHRIVVADSYYASVHTAQKTYKIGLSFIGVVKTNSRMYPRNESSTTVLPERGDCSAMISQSDERFLDMIALWSFNRERRYFIPTTSYS